MPLPLHSLCHLSTDLTLGLWKVVCGCTLWVLDKLRVFCQTICIWVQCVTVPCVGMVLTGTGAVLTCPTHPIPMQNPKCKIGTQQGNEYRNEKHRNSMSEKEQEARTILYIEILGSVLTAICIM